MKECTGIDDRIVAIMMYNEKSGTMLAVDVLTELQMSSRRSDAGQIVEPNDKPHSSWIETYKMYNMPADIPIDCAMPRIIRPNEGHPLSSVCCQVYCIRDRCRGKNKQIWDCCAKMHMEIVYYGTNRCMNDMFMEVKAWHLSGL